MAFSEQTSKIRPQSQKYRVRKRQQRTHATRLPIALLCNRQTPNPSLSQRSSVNTGNAATGLRTWQYITQRLENMASTIRTLTLQVGALQARVTEFETFGPSAPPSEQPTYATQNCPIDDCKRVFSRAEHLRRHIRDAPSSEHKKLASTLNKTYCDWCAKAYKRPEDYTRHEKHSHPEEFEKRHAWIQAGIVPPPSSSPHWILESSPSCSNNLDGFPPPQTVQQNLSSMRGKNVLNRSPQSDRFAAYSYQLGDVNIDTPQNQTPYDVVPLQGSSVTNRSPPDEGFAAPTPWSTEGRNQDEEQSQSQGEFIVASDEDPLIGSFWPLSEERFAPYAYWPGDIGVDHQGHFQYSPGYPSNNEVTQSLHRCPDQPSATYTFGFNSELGES
jgi:hypothetical protein